MGKIADAVQAIDALVTALLEVDPKAQEIATKAIMQNFNRLKPARATVTRIKKSYMQNYDANPDDWTEFINWCGDQEDLSSWHPLLYEEPTTDEKVRAIPKAEPSLKSYGISLKVPKYSGKQGQCASWWDSAKMILEAIEVPQSKWIPVVADALSDDALREFWRLFKESDNIDDITRGLTITFDKGAHSALLKKLQHMNQGKKSVMTFRCDFLAVIDDLATYNYKYDDDQLLQMFLPKLTNSRLVRLARPASIEEAVSIATDLEGSHLIDDWKSKTVDKSAGKSVKNEVSSMPRRGRTKEHITCFACGLTGHYRGDPECKNYKPKVKSDSKAARRLASKDTEKAKAIVQRADPLLDDDYAKFLAINPGMQME